MELKERVILNTEVNGAAKIQEDTDTLQSELDKLVLDVQVRCSKMFFENGKKVVIPKFLLRRCNVCIKAKISGIKKTQMLSPNAQDHHYVKW